MSDDEFTVVSRPSDDASDDFTVVSRPDEPRGLINRGNIDLNNRPKVKNPDGSYSTVRTITVDTPDGAVNIPTISPDGKNLQSFALKDPYAPAKERFRKTGENLGTFDTDENAEAAAQLLHEDQAKLYGDKPLTADDIKTQMRGKLGGLINGLIPENKLPNPNAPREGWLTTLPKDLRRAVDYVGQVAVGSLQGGIGTSPDAGVPLAYGDVTEATTQLPKHANQAAVAAMRDAGRVPDVMGAVRDEEVKSGILQQTAKRLAEDMKANTSNVEPLSAQGIAGVTIASALPMLATLITSYATKSPMVGTTLMGGMTYAGEMAQESADGIAPDKARLGAFVNGLSESAFEHIPLGAFMQPGKRFLARALEGARTELLQEALTQAFQTGYDKLMLDPNMTMGKALTTIIQAAGAGAFTGGLFGAFGGPRKRVTPYKNPDDEPDEELAPPPPPPPATPPAAVLSAKTADEAIAAAQASVQQQQPTADAEALQRDFPKVPPAATGLINSQSGPVSYEDAMRSVSAKAGNNTPESSEFVPAEGITLPASENNGLSAEATPESITPSPASPPSPEAVAQTGSIINAAPRAKKPRATNDNPEILDAVRELGGLNLGKGDTADIGAILQDYKNPPFKRRLINPDGLTPDEMRKRLQSAGWFGRTATQFGASATETGTYPGDDIRDLADLIDRSVRGEAVYHPEKTPPAAKYDPAEHEHYLDGRAADLGITRDPSWSLKDYDAEITEREAMRAENADLPDMADDRDAEFDDQFDRMRGFDDPLDGWASDYEQRSAEEAPREPGEDAEGPGGFERAEPVTADAGEPASVNPQAEGGRADAGTGVDGREGGLEPQPAPEPTKEEFAAYIARQKAERADLAQRVTDAMERDGRVVGISRENPNKKIVLTKGTTSPYQVTSFDGDEPSGHREYKQIDGEGNHLNNAVGEFGSFYEIQPPKNPPKAERVAAERAKLEGERQRAQEAKEPPVNDLDKRDSDEALSDRERALRDQASDKETPGDVMLANGKFVPFETALSAARAAVADGMRPFPAQLGFRLDIAARDWDRIIKALKPAEEAGAEGLPQTIIPGAEQDAGRAARVAEERRKLEAMRLRAKQSKMRKGGQEGVDVQKGGMFSNERDQSDLLGDPPAKAGEKSLTSLTSPTEAPKPSPPKEGSGYGESNTVFTQDAADAARERIRKKLRDQMNAGIDPELMQDGITLAGYHIESGARSFVDFARAMIADLGESVRPYLKSWYNAVRDYPGVNASGMTPYEQITPELVTSAGKETDDVQRKRAGLEQDRGDAAARNGNGETPFSSSAAGDERGAGSRAEGAAEGGSAVAGGAGLREPRAASVGARGDQRVQEEESGNDERSPGSAGRGGSPDTGDEGLPLDRTEPSAVEQSARDAASVKPSTGGTPEIRAALPTLFPEQHDDVAFAEERFALPDGHGVMFTNGTGTGKTYVGAGIAKRFYDAGKRNIMVVAPSQGILDAWVDAAKNLGFPISVLEDTSRAGRGPIATTYANLRANETLADREWDLVIADESHNLMAAGDAAVTGALTTLRAITNHPKGDYEKARMQIRAKLAPMDAEIAQLNARYEARQANVGDAERRKDLLDERHRLIRARVEQNKGLPRSKATFLSATPFPYDQNIDYAEGYLFDYGPDQQGGGYNAPGARSAFFMQHFGYRMRTGKLTKPDAGVVSDIMERQFHEWMRRQRVLSGRVLTVDKDYDRKFVLVDDAIGTQIDRAMEFLNTAGNGRFRPLADIVWKRFDYLSRMQLLEAIKAKHAVSYIKAQHALGRKVVVFHDYNVGGGFNPFQFRFAEGEEHSIQLTDGKRVTVKLADLVADFYAQNPYVERMDFSGLPSPLIQLTRAFPGALVYNGTVPKRVRSEAKARFNADGNPKDNLIIVQSAAGEAGISLHDTTGKFQRVILNLGMPVRPTTAIQEEGRIYRVGQATDAIFRYMNTGTNWERWTFASKIAERSGTAENLALGNLARTLKQSFINAFQESDSYPPSPDDGHGGKELDRALNQKLTPFEQAKTFYWAQQKKTGRRDQREGVDYYATPEPVGFKMVELANIRSGDRVLEPSAGHGAIARFFPEDSDRTIVEPSYELATKAALASPGARMLNERFEDLHVTNKFDAIVMNPPFGSGGKTAMEHVAKAVSHLRNGGRVVALIPDGRMATKRFEAFMESDAANGVYLAADIKLPTVTFERAGTSVRGHIVVLEKQTEPDDARRIQQADRDYSDVETIKELFDRIENASIKDRVIPTKPPEPVSEKKPAAATGGGMSFTTAGTMHAIKGHKVFVAVPENRVERDVYTSIAAIAKKHGGYYSAFKGRGAIPGFQFKSEEQRAAFMAEAGGAAPAADEDAPKFQRRPTSAGTDTPAFKRFFEGSKVTDAEGNPLRVYHHGSFEDTDVPNGAMHFGTEQAARERAFGKRKDDAAMAVQAYEGEGGGWHFELESGETSEDMGLPAYSSEDTAIMYGRSAALAEHEDSQYDAEDLGNTTAAYLSIKNPKRVPDLGGANGEWAQAVEAAKAKGHDGLVYRNQYEDKGKDSYVAFSPNQIKSADNNSGAFNPEDDRPRFQRASASKPTFFSALERGIEGVKQEKAPPGQWDGIIKNLPGVKQEEVEWSGLREFLHSHARSVTKQEIVDFLRENRVEVREVERGTPDTVTEEDRARLREALAPAVVRGDISYDEMTTTYRGVLVGYAKSIGDAEGFGVPDDVISPFRDVKGGPTKYGSYVLPGGENYRELLLTLPEKPVSPQPMGEKTKLDSGRWQVDYADRPSKVFNTESDADAEMQRIGAKWFKYNRDAEGRKENFRSSHFDEPNILAHVRFDDRTGPNGEKILHIAEVQSDWHQKGRKSGYQGDNKKNLTIKDEGGIWRVRDAQGQRVDLNGATGFSTEAQARDAIARNTRDIGGVPDAPFKQSWHELAMKRMLRYAAENGYDRLSWDTGETAAARFDLSKQVDEILYKKNDDGSYQLSAVDKSGRGHMLGENIAQDRLPDHVGKDVAEKIANGEGKRTEVQGKYDPVSMTGTKDYMHSLSGLDLKVGGEGMKGFYDKILPAFANKYVKKWGAKVEQSGLINPRGVGREMPNGRGGIIKIQDEPPVPVHSIAITPAMRDSVMEGQPLFQRGGDEGLKPAGGSYFEAPGRMIVEITPEARAAREELAARLRTELNRLNLPDIAERVVDKVIGTVDGPEDLEAYYFRKVITIALEAEDPMASLDHEVLHALRALRVITDKEWAILEDASRRRWMKQHDIEKLYKGSSDATKVEEGIAFALAKFTTDKRAAGVEPLTIRRIAEKVRDTLRAFRNAFRGLGFDTPARIFARIESGEVGARARPGDAANASRPQFMSIWGKKAPVNTPTVAERREPQQETVKIGADLIRLIELFGPKMYGEDMPQVTVKELLQNSFDAVKAASQRGDILGGRVDIDVNAAARTVTISDNGAGMTPQIVKDAFLTIAGTDKGDLAEAERSGGFGVAKLAFIFGNDGLHLETVRDGVKTTLDTTGKELLAGKSTLRTEPTDERPGTTVIVTFPAQVRNSAGDMKDLYLPAFGPSSYNILTKPLLGNVTVSFNGKDLAIGAKQPMDDFPRVTSAHFPWGDAEVYLRPQRKYTPSSQSVLSSGLYQFDANINKPGEYNLLPYDIIINVRPKVEASAVNYPFNNQRENWSPKIKDDIAQLTAFLQRKYQAEQARGIGGTFAQVRAMSDDGALTDLDLQRHLPNSGPNFQIEPDITIRDGQTYIGGSVTDATAELDKGIKAKDFRFPDGTIDAGQALYHNNLNVDPAEEAEARFNVPAARSRAYLGQIGQIFQEFRQALAQVPGYGRWQDNPVGISIDKEYHGVHIQVPFNGMFINPISQTVTRDSAIARSIVHTLFHEATHTLAGNHNEQFTMQFSRLDGAFEDFHPGLKEELERKVRKAVEGYRDAFDAMRNVFNDPTTKNIAKSEGLHSTRGEGGTDQREGRSSGISGRALGGREGDRGLAGGNQGNGDSVAEGGNGRELRFSGEDELAPKFQRRPPTTTTPGMPAPGEPLPKYAGNINLERIDTKDDVKRVVLDVADWDGDRLQAARRGTISHQETEALAAMIDPSELMQRKLGQAFNNAQSLRLRQLLEASADDVFEKSRVARGGSDQDRLVYMQALTRHVAIQEQVAGASAEAGRALESFKILAKAGDKADALKRMVEALGGREHIDAIAEMMSKLNSVEAISIFAKAEYKPTTWDMVMEAWINALLSGPQTHIVNAASNLLTALMSVPETMVAAGLGVFRNGQRVAPQEIMARVYGLVQGATSGLTAAAKAFETETLSNWATGRDSLGRRQAIPSVTLRAGKQKWRVGRVPVPFTGEVQLGGKQVRIPGRALLASDEFFKSLAFRQELNVRATRIGLSEGLKGKALARRVLELAQNPTKKMRAQAEEYAELQTFTNPHGATGRWVIQGINARTKIGRFLKVAIPFAGTMMNIQKFAAARSPFAYLFPEMRDDLKGKNGAIRQDQARARIILGTSFALAMAYYVAQGLVTGSGPDDPEERALWLINNRPNAFKVPGIGWVPYGRLEPFATIIGLVADTMDIYAKRGKEDLGEIGAMIVASVGQNILDKNYMRGASDIVNALQDPDRYAQRWADGLVGSVIPSVVAQYARADDPYIREARGMLDTLRSRTPGESQSLKVRRDVFGQPVKRPSTGSTLLDALDPFIPGEIANDPAAAEMERLNVKIPAIPRELGGVDLTPDEHDYLAYTTGVGIRKMVGAVISRPGYAVMTDFARKLVLDATVRGIHAEAQKDTKFDTVDLQTRQFKKKLEGLVPAP